jgi:hypothetical protein
MFWRKTRPAPVPAIDESGALDYLGALALAHRILTPANYCEIGCRFGYSLTLASAPALGIDPEFEIKAPLTAPTRLFRETSDDFFATRDLPAILGGPVDFAFIDGLHRVEFALRDFMNLERASHPGGVIAIDDLLPQDMAWATRERKTVHWTGDVYRLIPILQTWRPDLCIRIYDVAVKGFALISGLDPASTILTENYTGIEADIVAGRWILPSVEAIRATLAPSPIADLEPDLHALAASRPKRF